MNVAFLRKGGERREIREERERRVTFSTPGKGKERPKKTPRGERAPVALKSRTWKRGASSDAPPYPWSWGGNRRKKRRKVAVPGTRAPPRETAKENPRKARGLFILSILPESRMGGGGEEPEFYVSFPAGAQERKE